ncbi:MAG: CBS domain-containing protein [Pseudomonadota bacterium]
MNVGTILNAKGHDVTTVGRDRFVSDVAATLAEHRIGAVVVLGETGTLVGIVSERDIIQAIADRGAACLSEPVSGIMTGEVVTCGPTETVDEVMCKMTAGRFRHLPVTDDDDLIGIISIGDVVKNHIAEVEMEASALRSYIVSG